MTKETVALYLENGFKGRRNVISSRELERVLGISRNELRRRVNRLRQDTVFGDYSSDGKICRLVHIPERPLRT